jgi:hypothetical protein
LENLGAQDQSPIIQTRRGRKDDVLVTSEQREIALDDDAIETVLYQNEQAGKQLAEGFQRSPCPEYFVWQQDHRIEGRWESSGGATGGVAD